MSLGTEGLVPDPSPKNRTTVRYMLCRPWRMLVPSLTISFFQVTMASNLALTSTIIDVDCDDQQKPASEPLSSPGNTGTLNDLESIMMLQLASGRTPISQSFRNASPASSARSSSPTPSIFDDDLSPAETPLTAPLPKEAHPSSPADWKLKIYRKYPHYRSWTRMPNNAAALPVPTHLRRSKRRRAHLNVLSTQYLKIRLQSSMVFKKLISLPRIWLK